MRKYKNKPLISILVNFHNGAEFLQDALMSIANQTYSNFEVILCNNSSTDSSLDIVETFIINDSRFKLVHTPEFCSLGKARNIALKNAHGDYIAFLDSDDLWHKDKLLTQLDIFESNVDINFIHSNYFIQKNNVKKIFNNKKIDKTISYDNFITSYDVCISTVIFRYQSKANKIYFDERLEHIEEFDFFVRLLHGAEAFYIGKPLASYRIHENMNSISNLKKDISIEFEYFKNNLLNSNLSVSDFIINYFDIQLILKPKIKFLLLNGYSLEARKHLKKIKFISFYFFTLYLFSFLPRNFIKTISKRIFYRAYIF